MHHRTALSPRPSLVWLLLPAVFGVVGVVRHEWWQDEATTVLILRSSNTVGELLANVGFNGHPKAYYVASWALHQVTPSLLVFSLVNLAFVVIAMGFFYRSAPFSPLQTVLFSMGFFPLYQYGVFARSYAILLCLLFAYCHLRTTRPDAIALRFVVLAALAQTHLFGITAAAAFVAFELAEALRNGRLERRFYLPAAVGLISVAFALWQIYPGDRAVSTSGATSITTVFSGFANGFLPNYGLLDEGGRAQRWLGLALGIGSIFLLVRRPRALAVYALLGGSVLAVVAIVYSGMRWHHGFYFIFLLTALWASGDAPLRGVSSRFLTLVLSVHVAIGMYALARDFSRPYSSADLAAKVLRDAKLDGMPIVGLDVNRWPPDAPPRFRWDIANLQAILLHLPESRAYDPLSRTYERHWRHYANHNLYFPLMDSPTLDRSLSEIAARLGKPFLLIEGDGRELDKSVRVPPVSASPRLHLIADLPESLDVGEHYRIFLYTADSNATGGHNVRNTITWPDTMSERTGTAPRQRLLVFIVAYNAEKTIEKTLRRIPVSLGDRFDVEILVIDDSSKDRTFEEGEAIRNDNSLPFKLTVLFNPVNQGYGGNQKLGFHYAVDRGFDFVALVHGDGQYAPECLPDLVAPLAAGEADAVFGSRMLTRGGALKGGMPLYKFVGNKILTYVQNRLLRSNLSEFHSGYRLYSVEALRRIPFHLNNNAFHFDTEIIIQLMIAQLRIREIAIPTYYGDEISHVNGMKYAKDVIIASVKARAQELSLMYDRRFDCRPATTSNAHYASKLTFDSTHSRVVRAIPAGARVLDIGCAGGYLGTELMQRGCHVTGLDMFPLAAGVRLDAFHLVDLNRGELPVDFRTFDHAIMLDVIEHLLSPETFTDRLLDASAHAPGLRFIITTGNIGFVFNRLMLLIGKFNYGKRGILDLTHTRLFTFKTLRGLLEQSGFDVIEVSGVPAPFPLALGDTRLSRVLIRVNNVLIAVSKGMFSYQMLMVARPRPSLPFLLREAHVQSAVRASGSHTAVSA